MSERIIKSIDYEGLWRSRHFWNSKKSHAETEIWAMSYGINRLDQRCRYFLFSLKWMNNLCPDRFLVCVTSNSFFDLQVYGTFQQNETSIKILIIDFFAADLIYFRHSSNVPAVRWRHRSPTQTRINSIKSFEWSVLIFIHINSWMLARGHNSQSFQRQLEFRNLFQVNRFWTWDWSARHVISKFCGKWKSNNCIKRKIIWTLNRFLYLIDKSSETSYDTGHRYLTNDPFSKTNESIWFCWQPEYFQKTNWTPWYFIRLVIRP